MKSTEKHPRKFFGADIWGNSSVKVKGHILSWDNWIKKGIIRFSDLCEKGNFIRFAELKGR